MIQSTDTKPYEMPDVERHRNQATLFAMRFLDRLEELAELGVTITDISHGIQAFKPTTVVQASYTPSRRHASLQSVLSALFGSCPVLGPQNLSGPFNRASRNEYRLAEYGVNGDSVDNTIIRIACSD